MNITIVYDSSTGKTRQASEAMCKLFKGHGHQCQVYSVGKIKPEEVKNADLICVGTWVKGLFIIKQHPTEASMQFIDELGDLNGKRVVVFCTYLLAAGSTLKQMSHALQANGAEVLARFKYRGPVPGSKFTSFAASI